MLTGYLLNVLAGDRAYSEFADPEAAMPQTQAPDPEAEPVTLEDKVVTLLKL